MSSAFDICALLGAGVAMLVFMVFGAIRDRTFNWYFLIDSLGGAIAGAMLVPGLADIPATDPCWERVVAGALLAMGAKFGIRALVSKPMQDKQEAAVLKSVMHEVAEETGALTKPKAVRIGQEIKRAKTPEQVASVLSKILPKGQ